MFKSVKVDNEGVIEVTLESDKKVVININEKDNGDIDVTHFIETKFILEGNFMSIPSDATTLSNLTDLADVGHNLVKFSDAKIIGGIIYNREIITIMDNHHEVVILKDIFGSKDVQIELLEKICDKFNTDVLLINDMNRFNEIETFCTAYGFNTFCDNQMVRG